MDDFRVQTSWRTHRKRKRLRKMLGADAVLAIEDLWSYATSERPDGSLDGMSAQDIADEVDYPGDPARLMAALVDLRLVDGVEGSWSLHDWADNQPFVVGKGKRSEAARHAASVRWASKDDAVRMRDACPPYAPSLLPTNQPERDRARAETGPAGQLADAFGRMLSSTESDTLRELQPTADEVERAIVETKAKASKPNVRYALSVIESGRKASAPAAAPKRDPRIGYHPGGKPEDFFDGILDLNTIGA